jgi:hypothetical protein
MHHNVMKFIERLGKSTTLAEFTTYGRLATALARAYTDQMAAHKHYGSTNEPAVRVQNVSVQDGGRAIVGNVTQNAGVALPNQTARPALAITDAKLAPMPRVSERQRQRVPRVRPDRHE